MRCSARVHLKGYLHDLRGSQIPSGGKAATKRLLKRPSARAIDELGQLLVATQMDPQAQKRQTRKSLEDDWSRSWTEA